MEKTNTSEIKVLIKEVRQNHNEKALLSLYSIAKPVFLKTYQKYQMPLQASGCDFENFDSECIFLLFSFCKKFKVSKKTSFRSFVSHCFRYHCLDRMRQTNADKLNCISFINVEDVKNFIPDQSSLQDSGVTTETIEQIFKSLNKLDKRIAKLFYIKFYEKNSNSSWSDLANKMGLSISSCRILYNRGINHLRNSKLFA